jgi:hypothetical protein
MFERFIAQDSLLIFKSSQKHVVQNLLNLGTSFPLLIEIDTCLNFADQIQRYASRFSSLYSSSISNVVFVTDKPESIPQNWFKTVCECECLRKELIVLYCYQSEFTSENAKYGISMPFTLAIYNYLLKGCL